MISPSRASERRRTARESLSETTSARAFVTPRWTFALVATRSWPINASNVAPIVSPARFRVIFFSSYAFLLRVVVLVHVSRALFSRRASSRRRSTSPLAFILQ